MVKETRIVFGLNDIKALRYQCGRCKGEVLQALGRDEDVPRSCPLCPAVWVHGETDGVNYALVAALRRVLSQEGDLPMNIRLELDGQVAESPPPATA